MYISVVPGPITCCTDVTFGWLQGIPVVGAIMVSPDMEKCLLVRGWGPQASWGFPRGKVNEAEPDAACAVREVRLIHPLISMRCDCAFCRFMPAHCALKTQLTDATNSCLVLVELVMHSSA